MVNLLKVSSVPHNYDQTNSTSTTCTILVYGYITGNLNHLAGKL